MLVVPVLFFCWMTIGGWCVAGLPASLPIDHSRRRERELDGCFFGLFCLDCYLIRLHCTLVQPEIDRLVDRRIDFRSSRLGSHLALGLEIRIILPYSLVWLLLDICWGLLEISALPAPFAKEGA